MIHQIRNHPDFIKELDFVAEYDGKVVGNIIYTKAIVLLGDPHNYCKHGFKSGKDLNISDMNGEYPYGMLALALEERALEGHKWKFKYSDACNINEEDADNFDKNFERKEKGYRYSQDIFSIAFRSYVK